MKLFTYSFHATGVNISQALQSILESWALPENKLTCTITDNGSNVITAVEILKE